MSEHIDNHTGEITEGDLTPQPEARRQLPPMPIEIAKAIIQVSKLVKNVAKDDVNNFGKFRYTSVDAFYEAIGPLMANAGLIVFTDEADTQMQQRETTDDQGRNRVTNWLVSQYEIFVYHESGAQWGPIHRKMMVAATGPQAYGSGQSYVEKYFLRGLFKVPTGEGDADAEPQVGLPALPRGARPAPPPLQRARRQPAPPPGAEGDKQMPEGIRQFLQRDNYEINVKPSGGWPQCADWFGENYLKILAYCGGPQAAKLQRDNGDNIMQYQSARPKEYVAFAKSLLDVELIAPDDAATILQGANEAHPFDAPGARPH